MLFPWFKKSRKKEQNPSFPEIEQAIRSASYQAERPTPEFADLLKRKLLEARRRNQPNMEKSPFSFTFGWKKWIPAIALASIILILLPVLIPFFQRTKLLSIDRAYAQTAFEAVAVQSDGSGVEAATPFRIKTRAPVNEGDLRRNIRFEPETVFEISKISDTEFEVTTAEPLDAGAVYNLIIDAAYQNENGISIPKEFRFAFQVKDTFKIAKTTPGDKTNQVGLNTGIEIKFSHEGVSLDEFKKLFSITPAIEGEFEEFPLRKIIVFKPKNRLEPSTLYTAVVAKGLSLPQTRQKLEQDYSFQFFTTSAEREFNENTYVSFRRESLFQSFQTGSSVRLPVELGRNLPPETEVKVFKFNSFADAQNRMKGLANLPGWVCLQCFNWEIDTNNLPVVLSTTISDAVVKEGDAAGSSFYETLSLPPLSNKGIYAVEISTSARRAQSVFIVTNFKAFALASKTSSFVWVHDSQTQNPAAGVSVSLPQNSISVETDDKGLAMFTTPVCPQGGDYSYYGHGLLEIKGQNDELIVLLDRVCRYSKSGGEWWYSYERSDNYWSTLSTDRPIYLPTDTVNFWGIAKQKTNHMPEELTVELRNYENLIAVQRVNSSALGSFHGSFELKNQLPRGYSIIIKNSAGEQIAWKDFEVVTFQKPLYNMSVTLDKNAVYAGEKIKAVVKVALFDGTAAPNIELRYNYGTEDKTVRTNKNGEAEVVIETPMNLPDRAPEPYYYANPEWRNIYFEPVSAEYGLSRIEKDYNVFRADMAVSLEQDYSSKTPLYKGKVQNIDISKFNQDTWGDFYSGPSANHAVNVEIIKITDEKKETGSYYDEITKTVEKTYSYEKKEESAANFSANTDSNGEFAVNYQFDRDFEYRIIARILDSQGRQNYTSAYFYPSMRVPDYAAIENKLVELRKVNEEKTSYSIGDNVQLKLYQGGAPMAQNGKYLFVQMQNGILNAETGASPEYGFVFGQEHVPGVTVSAVVFDGAYYYSTFGYGSAAYLNFNTEDKRLKIEIAPNKEKYRPGEEAALEITAKNHNDQPVSAEVNLGIVDEAIFALREFYNDPLMDIYGGAGDGFLSSFNSAADPKLFNDLGGKGGGGAEGEMLAPRQNFKNTAYFGSVVTDALGRASVTVKLPDDITSFRITAQGFSQDISAGMAKKNIATSLPFFADFTMNDVYLAGDKPQIRFRVFGEEIKDENAQVSYTVSAPSLGEQNKVIVKTAKEDLWYELPALTAGGHEITVRARFGNYSDAIKKTLRVVDSQVTVPVTSTRQIVNGLSLADISAKRARLVFSLAPYGEYYEQLERLKWSWISRLDARLASLVSKKLLAQYFGEPEEEQENLAIFQNTQGALRLLPYDSGDLEASWRAAVFADMNFADSSALEKYFDFVLEQENSNLDELAMAWAGKAAMKLPVLNDVKLFIAHQANRLAIRDKLALAYGLAALGDSAGANNLLDAVMKDRTKKEGGALILTAGRDNNENYELTALAGAIASMTSHIDAQSLFAAARRYQPTHTLTNLEQVVMLKAFLTHLAPLQGGGVSYSAGGRSGNIKLKNSQQETLYVGGDELKTISFSNVQGPIAVTVYYDAPFAETAPALSDALNIRRHYEVNGVRTNTFKEGDIVKVVLESSPRSGGPKGIEIIDTLPNGLIPMTQVYYGFDYLGKGENADIYWYPNFIEGQKLSFRMYGRQKIAYFARIVSKGRFIAEPAIVSSISDNSLMNVSEAGEVEIK